jgi:hypothetical protein
VNLLNLFAFKLADGQGINFLDTEKLAGLSHLPIQLLDLLW